MGARTVLSFDRTFLTAGERVCAAVSGGADSVALLLALHESNQAKEPLGVVLSAVHVHHGLRGAEADADEAFVRELCERLGVPLIVERVDVAARQAAEREGVEEAARELRYAVFRGLMAAGRVDSVATAHTLDDQAETVVMKLLRGAWTEGIGGIAPVAQGPGSRVQGPENSLQSVGTSSAATFSAVLRDRPPLGPGPWTLNHGRIVRPMLGVRRAAVEAFLRERGQAWREDATNRDVSLTRNRVRHELMPALRGFNPAVDVALARLAEIARDEEAYWQAEVARVLPQVLLPGKPIRGGGRAVGTEPGNSSCAVEVERLRGLAPALRRRVMRAAARSLGCRISAEETAKLLALGGFPPRPASRLGTPGFEKVTPPVGSKPGTRLELAGGLRAERTAREIQLRVENASFVAKTGIR